MAEWTLKEKSTGDLVVTIEGDEWKDAVNKAFNKLSKNVSMNGFRKGQVPAALLEKRISQAERQAEAIDSNLNAWLIKGITEANVNPISRPNVNVTEMDADHAVLVYTFQVYPEVKLGEYKGLAYNLENTDVTDEELDAELTRMRETYADLTTKEGAAEDGDTVNIDYEGFKDGVPFDGGKAENYNLLLGSGSFIPGFEEQLVGASAGEEKELNLTFPEDYHAEDLKGAAVVFKVKVNEVKTKVLPEIDDDFAKDVNAPGVETVDDLKKLVRDRLEGNKKNAAEEKADNDLFEALTSAAEVDLPDVLVDEQIDGMVNQLSAQLAQYGMKVENFLQMQNKTVEDLRNDQRPQAERDVKLRLVLEKIASVENIEVTDEELEKEYADLAEQYGLTVERVKAAIQKEDLTAEVKNQKAYEFVKENAAKPE